MPYATVEQVTNEVRCLAATIDINADLIQEKIQEADDVVNGYIGKVYKIPFVCQGRVGVVPHLVNQISKKLATAYYIEWVFGVKAQTSAGLSTAERIIKRYMDMLGKMVARKEAAPILFCEFRPGVGLNEDGGFETDPTTDDATSEPFSTLGWSNTEGYVPTFDDDKFEHSVVDPNKILVTRIKKQKARERSLEQLEREILPLDPELGA